MLIRPTLRKSWYQVAGTNDVCRIKETKRIGIVYIRDEANTIQVTCSGASPIGVVLAKPADPQHVHEFGGRQASIRVGQTYIDMKDVNDLCVPKWVMVPACGIFSGMHHDVTVVCARIQGILAPTNVIRGEIHMQGLVSVHAMLDKIDAVALGITKLSLIAILLLTQQSSQDVVLQACVETLRNHSVWVSAPWHYAV
jgi:hypothetical protein